MTKILHSFFVNYHQLCHRGALKVEQRDVLQALQRARSSSLFHWLVKGRSAADRVEATETPVF